MALTTWKLAKNQDIQEKLYQEIQDAIAHKQGSMKSPGSELMSDQHLDYNYLQNNMPYLEGNGHLLTIF